MKSLSHKRLFSGFALVLSLFLVGASLYWRYGGIPFKIETREEGEILARTTFTLKNFIFVHSDESRLLFVGGNRFSTLRGSSPFFLRVPGKQAVVFVTDEDNGMLYYYSMESGRAQRMRINDFSFGYGIGTGRDTIESMDGSILTLRSNGTLVSQIIKVDVGAGKLLSIQKK